MKKDFFCRSKDWRRIATRYETLIGALYWMKL